jgi:hypothetical protein
MKLYKLLVFAFMLAGIACKKDNLEPPASTLTGKVVFQDQPIGVRSTGVQFEIWQPGYQLFTKIPLNIKQDGTFSSLLYDGDYKIVRAKGAGPWTDNTDTINVKVNGAATVDIPIDPFFIIKNATFEKVGSAIKGTFTIEKNTTTKTVELARLYIGPNLVLDQNNNAANVQVLPAAITFGIPVSVTVNIPAAIANDNFIFARAGVKTLGTAELLYTMSQKVQLK